MKEGAEGMPTETPKACIAPLYKHAQESVHKCRDIETAVTGLETQGSCLETQSSGGTCFPIVAGKRHKFGGHHRQPNASSSSGSKGSSGQGRDSVDRGHSRDHKSLQSPSLSNLCATSCSPSVLQFPDSMKVCNNNNNNNNVLLLLHSFPTVDAFLPRNSGRVVLSEYQLWYGKGR